MRLALAAAALLLGLPSAASAQRDDEKLIAEQGGSRLLAHHARGGGLCMTLEYPKGTGGTCAERVSVREPAIAPLAGATAGAVAPEVERVEVEWPDGVRTPVRPTAHESFPGVRFFLATHGTRAAFLMRYYSADGTLLLVEQEEDGPRVAGPVTLESGRGWWVRGWLERVHARAPGAPERTEVVACIEHRMRGGTRSTSCLDGEPRLEGPIRGDVFPARGYSFRPGPRRPHETVTAALLNAGATRVDVHLGNGRRVRARVRELTAEGVTGRFATHAARPADAVRKLVVRDAAGESLDEQVVTIAPGALGHPGSASLFTLRPPLPGTPEVAAGPVQDGEGVLTVREVGARLCAEVERSRSSDVPCGLIPEDADDSLLVAGASARHGVVGGVVPPEVATVELKELGAFAAPGPATVRVTPQAPAPYAGAFAPHVRTFVGLLPVGGLVGVRLLDASGKELSETTLRAASAFDEDMETPRRLRTRLRVNGVRLLHPSGDDECVLLFDAVAGLVHSSCSFGAENREAEVHVACRPAAAVVIVPVAKSRRDLVLRTARGRVIRPVRLRLGKAPHAVFAVRAPDAPRALTWRGGRLGFGRVPSPRKQCGYELELELPLRGPGG